MKQNRNLKPILSVGMTVVILAGAMTWLGPAQPVRAAGIWYVTPAGDDSADCATPSTPCATIQAAVDKAVDGDTIQVSIGTYTRIIVPFETYFAVEVRKGIYFSGGWNSVFSQQNGLSIVDAQNTLTGFLTASFTEINIERFVIQNGVDGVYHSSGGILNSGYLTLTDSLITHNHAEWGGGVYNNGTLTIKNSTLSYNSADEMGGGIYNYGSLYILNSTISHNNASRGGGIANCEKLYLNNADIVDNTSTIEGGGIYSFDGGIANTGIIYIQNTILANNGGPSPDCAGMGTIVSQGYNLIEDGAGCTALGGDLTGNITGLDPLLQPYLDAYGYYPLSPTSPARNAGNPSGCMDAYANYLTTDQRGAPRLDWCDIGAYEYTIPGPVDNILIVSGDYQSIVPHRLALTRLQVCVRDSVGSPVALANVTLTAPSIGPGGTFEQSGIAAVTTITDVGGCTPLLEFRANGLPGSYSVPATSGTASPANFVLTNLNAVYMPLVLRPDPAQIVDEFPFTDRCVSSFITYNGLNLAKWTECVTRVRIRQDGQMYFDIRWSVQFLNPNVTSIYKYSDADNHNMYITDNLGNRYDHVATGGAAAELTYFYPTGPLSADGWFLFPRAQPGATIFTFHDDDHTPPFAIGNLILVH